MPDTPSESLQGRVVAVTGAGRGIGLAIARAFVAAGAEVAMSDIDEACVADAAKALGVTCHQRLDVTDGAAFGEFLAAVEAQLGELDVLVNNAGIMPTGPLLDEDDEVSRRILEINTLGVVFGTKRALALMVPRGRGHIVNMASTMGEMAVPGLDTYNASKAATILFSDAARAEFRSAGVHISTVLPGGVNTELTHGVDATIGVPIPGTGKSVAVVKHVETTDVAAAVVEVVGSGRSHPRRYVPRRFGALLKANRVVPRSWSDALNRAMGAERKVLLEADHDKRAAYLARTRRS